MDYIIKRYVKSQSGPMNKKNPKNQICAAYKDWKNTQWEGIEKDILCK